MEQWIPLAEHAALRNFYDQHDRLVAVLVTNGVAVLIQCTIEGHFLMVDDFLKAGDAITFVECASLKDGITLFTKQAESLFEVDVLEHIAEQLLYSLT